MLKINACIHRTWHFRPYNIIQLKNNLKEGFIVMRDMEHIWKEFLLRMEKSEQNKNQTISKFCCWISEWKLFLMQ